MSGKWIDVSVTLQSGMVHWPDNPPVRIERMLDMDKGGVCNVSTISMGSHTGTHMDSPLHFLREGVSLDQMPPEATVGPARVIEIKNPVAIDADELKPHKLKAGERILFKTRNSRRDWVNEPFDEDFIYISQEAARLMARARVRTVGVDYLSVGGFKRDGVETHQILLGQGIWIVEGLNLGKIKPGRYELLCLPIKVAKSDGAPARALVRKIP